MPQQWALWLSVEDDLRFLSHHDMMRVIERASARAALPLRYSQGFNPHAILSLACPRPVGVASRDDLLILSLEDSPACGVGVSPACGVGVSPACGVGVSPASIGPQELLDRMNRVCPAGMKFFKAQNISAGGLKILHPRRINYELPLTAEQSSPLKARLDELARQECWTIERTGKKAVRRFAGVLSASGVGVPPAKPVARPPSAVRQCGTVALGCAKTALNGKPVAGLDVARSLSVAQVSTAHTADGGCATGKSLDLKALVVDLRLEGDVLHWTHQPRGESWARPSEVLGLLGLDGRIDLARVVRTGVEYA